MSERLQVLDQIALLLRGQVQVEVPIVVLDDRGKIRSAAVVEVGRVLPQTTQRRRAIAHGGASERVVGFGADLIWIVQQRYLTRRTVQHVGERRSLMTVCAARLIAKQAASAISGLSIEAPFG